MRVLILASNYSLTTATALAHMLKMERLDIVGVVTIKGIFKKKPLFGSIVFSIQNQGLRYTINKSIDFFLIKLRNIYFSLFKNRNNEIFHSLDEVKLFFDFKEYKIQDINSEESEKLIKSLDADIIFSLSFPYILKENILNIPKLGTMNLHRSYLPGYRGGSPVFWVRANRESKTGFSIHHIDKGPVDSGNILIQRSIDLNPGKDSHRKIMVKLSKQIPEALNLLFSKINHQIPEGKIQDDKKATTFKKPKKSDRIKYRIWD